MHQRQLEQRRMNASGSDIMPTARSEPTRHRPKPSDDRAQFDDPEDA